MKEDNRITNDNKNSYKSHFLLSKVCFYIDNCIQTSRAVV